MSATKTPTQKELQAVWLAHREASDHYLTLSDVFRVRLQLLTYKNRYGALLYDAVTSRLIGAFPNENAAESAITKARNAAEKRRDSMPAKSQQPTIRITGTVGEGSDYHVNWKASVWNHLGDYVDGAGALNLHEVEEWVAKRYPGIPVTLVRPPHRGIR